ncbi:MAG TPA: hypothetical protein VI796_06845, partial [Candidatus Thermoplasmatota archaeon]|nr:hypothetical protein [Candidatus Thermoplasmatota archaeon]
DDVVVVVPPNKAVAARTQAAPAPAGSFRPLGDPDSITAGARLAIAHALYRDLGAEGTVLESPKGTSFALRSGVGRGEVRTPHAVLVPLPEGHVTPHQADLVVELENGALLVLDVVTTGIRPEDLKGLAYDALQFRRLDRCFAVLVVVRVPRSALSQDQVQALGHGYDHFFGVTEDDARSEMKYAALRSRVAAWISAAGGR